MIIIADIDIFNLKPNVVSPDLCGKSILIYGPIKTGKTTIACQFPSPLLLGFEKGYGMIPGIMAVPIFKWSEALKAKRQLMLDARDVQQGKKPETTFKTVIIDTADQQYTMAEKYICEQDDKDELRSVRGGYGIGYLLLSRELDTFVQDLVKVGYTLVVISHAEQVQIDVDNQEPYMKIQPSIPKRGLKIYEDLVDIVAYAEPTSGEDGAHSQLILRGSKTLDAGSRYKYMPARIPFTYEALSAAVREAVDKIAQEHGEEAVTTEVTNIHALETPNDSYDDLIAKIRKLNKVFRENNQATAYTAIVEAQLGKDRLVKECTPNQTDVLTVIANELEAKADELGLVVMTA